MPRRKYNLDPKDDRTLGPSKYGDRRRIASPYANECPRCGRDMEHTSDMVKTSRGAWVHRGCAGGADDE